MHTDWLRALLVAVAVVQLSSFCTTIYLHRCLAHRALTLNPLVAFFMRLHLWLATGMVPREWVAVHRKHHHFTDREGDPHSPILKGLWKILLGNAFYYAREAANPETVSRYTKDMEDDWFDRALFHRGLLGLGVGIVLFVLLLGPWWGGLGFAFQAVTYIFLSAVINGAGHAIGYKNYDNEATNMRLVAWITAGEGLHNNHHAFPSSPKLSVKWSEIDPAWPLIRVLAGLRLAGLRPPS
ncbi:MAG: fatty acid desaturase [Acidobacteria bacterium]|nr:fatty acid desaturase [Acidobacteriota bacterium]